MRDEGYFNTLGKVIKRRLFSGRSSILYLYAGILLTKIFLHLLPPNFPATVVTAVTFDQRGQAASVVT